MISGLWRCRLQRTMWKMLRSCWTLDLTFLPEATLLDSREAWWEIFLEVINNFGTSTLDMKPSCRVALQVGKMCDAGNWCWMLTGMVDITWATCRPKVERDPNVVVSPSIRMLARLDQRRCVAPVLREDAAMEPAVTTEDIAVCVPEVRK